MIDICTPDVIAPQAHVAAVVGLGFAAVKEDVGSIAHILLLGVTITFKSKFWHSKEVTVSHGAEW